MEQVIDLFDRIEICLSSLIQIDLPNIQYFHLPQVRLLPPNRNPTQIVIFRHFVIKICLQGVLSSECAKHV